jgi:tetratricopeptide (TPR) repeat protein
MRISHLILFLGGLALLTEAKRFVNEYALLALPMLAANIPIIPSVTRAKRVKIAATLLTVAFMVMPFLFMHYFFYDRPRYPVSARDLPEGVALFLKRVNGSGSVMNYPDTGGYYEWELYPRYKIFMDLQVPFLFPAEDFETARNVYVDQRALRKVITRYRPDFIAVPISMQGFKTLIADHPQYHLIFFDDAEALYGDSSRKPDLISRNEIRSLDPFALYKEPLPEKPDSRQELQELLRLAEMYPGGGIVNAAIAALYQRQGRFREALPHAEAVIRTYPESHLGYQLKAELLSRLGACGEALPFYDEAAGRSEGAMKELIEKQASTCRMP